MDTRTWTQLRSEAVTFSHQSSPGLSQSESVMTFPEPLLQLTVSMCWCGFGWSAVWLQISGLPAAAALKWTEWSQSDVQRNALQVSVTALHAVRSTEVMSTLAQWASLKPAHCKQPMLTCQRPRLVRQGELSLQFLLTNDDRVEMDMAVVVHLSQPSLCSDTTARGSVPTAGSPATTSSVHHEFIPRGQMIRVDFCCIVLSCPLENTQGKCSGRSIEVPLKTIQKCTWRWPWVSLKQICMDLFLGTSLKHVMPTTIYV